VNCIEAGAFEPFDGSARRKVAAWELDLGYKRHSGRTRGFIMRMIITVVFLSAGLLGAAVSPLSAQDSTQGSAPGVITGGSSKTLIGGQAAARRGDQTDDGNAIADGSKDVYIDGKPAAVLGSRTGCGGGAVGGLGNVFINGKPAARAGDLTTGCPGK
jgi:uncharacterized Zn-binding protein involved in type VI secretion